MRPHIIILFCYFVMTNATFFYRQKSSVTKRLFGSISNGPEHGSSINCARTPMERTGQYEGKLQFGCYCGSQTHNILDDDYITIRETIHREEFCYAGQQCIPPVYRTFKDVGVFGAENMVPIYTRNAISSESEFIRNPYCMRRKDTVVKRCSNRQGLYRNLGLCICNDVFIFDAYCNERFDIASEEPVPNCEHESGRNKNELFGEFCLCDSLDSRCTYNEYCHATFKKCSSNPILDLALGQCQQTGGHKTNSPNQVCQCGSQYCDGQEYCLVDGTCSKIGQPICPDQDGIISWSGSSANPVCICGNGDNIKKVSRHYYCDKDMPKNHRSVGQMFKTCHDNPYKSLTEVCTCGTETSDSMALYRYCWDHGDFCLDNGKCSTTPKDCPNKDGTVPLDLKDSVDTSCKCGTVKLFVTATHVHISTSTIQSSGIATHGMYCNADANLVSSVPIPTCEKHHGPQPQVCACGSTQCDANQYCNFKLQRCDDIPNGQCSHVLGQIRNENTCACGKSICNAPGQFCDCGIDSLECNINEHATCSSYQQCSNTVGDVVNEKACQCGTAPCGPTQFCNRDKNLCSATPNAICEPSKNALETSCYCEPQGDTCPQGKVCHPSDGCIDTAAECDGRQACNCEGTICKAGDFCDETDKVCTPYNTSSTLTYLTVKERTCEDQNHYSIYGKTPCKIAAQQYKNLTDVDVLEKESEFRKFDARHSGEETYYRDIRYPKGCTWLPLQEYANSHSPNSDTPCSGALECLCALPNCKAEDVDIVNYKCACHGKTCTSESGLYCYTLNLNVDARCQQYPQCTIGQQASQTCMCSEGHECQAGEYCKRNGICDTQIPCARNTQLTGACVCGNHDCSSGEYCIGNVCSPTATLPTATCGNQTTTDCICEDRVCTSSQTCRDNDCVEILNFDAKYWIPTGSSEGGEYCVSHRYLPPSELCETNKIISNTCNCGNYTGAPNELCKDNEIYRAF